MSDIVVKKNDSMLAVGVGSALVDILLQESDEFLSIKTDGTKGGMTLVDDETINSILAQTLKKPKEVPGGSACNTIIGLGKLNKNARFIGKCGNDKLGTLFENSLISHNVKPVLDKTDTPTGRVLSLITPDAQRSMFTFLGASSEAKPSEFTADKFEGAALVHLEGYLLFNQELIFAALKAAKESGALISLDLASFTVVEAAKDILSEIINDYVDIILANEDEACAYTGTNDEQKALDILAPQAMVSVVKLGKRGSYIHFNGKNHHIGIVGKNSALDTTGAGDLWASGFLYGILKGMDIKQSGKLAAACGGEVCQIIGAHIPTDGWNRIKKFIR